MAEMIIEMRLKGVEDIVDGVHLDGRSGEEVGLSGFGKSREDREQPGRVLTKKDRSRSERFKRPRDPS